LQYLIPTRAKECFSGSEPLLPGEEIVSVLLPLKEGYERRDYCLACWEREAKEFFTATPHWRLLIAEKEKKAIRQTTSDERALEILRAKIVDTSEEAQKLAYVTALYLERRERLIKRQERRGIFFFEIPETQEVVTIERHPLSPEELQQIEEQLRDGLQ
jgi:hypothetical protein